MPPGPAAALPDSLTVMPDRLILATAAGLMPALAPLLPGAAVVTDLNGLPAALNGAEHALIRLVAIGFGGIVPAPLLDRCRAGTVNFHPAPPDYPGSAANHMALYEGATRFGVTAHVMVAAIDAGPILAIQEFPIPPGAGHRTLDELTWPALLTLVGRLAPCLAGAVPWPVPAPLSWRGPARQRRQVLALARITADMDAAEQRRRWQAFHEGPDSILTIEQDGETRPYRPGGRVRAWIDGIIGDAIQGWAHDPGRGPVMVRVEVDGRPFRDLRADAPRGDVAAAGHGDGHCGFSLPLADLPAGATRVDFLLPSDEWCRIGGSPILPPFA